MNVGDALVDVVLDEVPAPPRSRLRGLLDWLAEMAKPPVGVRLLSDDGGTFSGVVVVEDNRPILMLAFRTSDSERRALLEHTPRAEPIADEEWANRPDTTLK